MTGSNVWELVGNFINGGDKIGYWPKELFPHLANGATSVRYGGMVSASPQGASPPMGTGQYPSVILQDSCYFQNIQIINSNNQKVEINGRDFQGNADATWCYNLEYYGDQGPELMGETFSFGGSTCGR
ncbi:hypothetical protein Tsubulata_045602 [Turnera subulata]|uniref:Neprosin PEP catalytic domain-containing protein n=1 Tax=Turnera subulata TaxID=218843 RepID=A0A9Q0F1V7_9ROSI|nr:hypothetical protein Tsubulata_045602 [Turnera subulata]